MSKTFDRFASLAFLLVGILFMVESRKISASAYGSQVGPDIFPFGLGLVCSLLAVSLLLQTFRYPKSAEATKTAYDYKRFGVIFLTALLYAFFLEEIGFVIGTFVFLLIGFQTMEKGKWLSSTVIAAAFSYGLYYLFVQLLQGTLPGWPVWFGL